MRLRNLMFLIALWAAPALAAEKTTATSAAAREPALYTRMILVQKPENLKKVKGLDNKKNTAQLLVDYLKQNKVSLESPAYARFDEKTQAVTVHATLADLDKAETALVKLRDGK